MDRFRARLVRTGTVLAGKVLTGTALAGVALALSLLPAAARPQDGAGAPGSAPVVTAAVANPALPAEPPSGPPVLVRIHLSTQSMEVWVEGRRRHSWPVSTARRGYRTPVGSYRPYRMHKRYFSRKYDNAPMPYAIFYDRGYAIHGTTDLRRLGRPASHGCVRLAPDNAKTLFSLVGTFGAVNTRIVIAR